MDCVKRAAHADDRTPPTIANYFKKFADSEPRYAEWVQSGVAAAAMQPVLQRHTTLDSQRRLATIPQQFVKIAQRLVAKKYRRARRPTSDRRCSSNEFLAVHFRPPRGPSGLGGGRRERCAAHHFGTAGGQFAKRTPRSDEPGRRSRVADFHGPNSIAGEASCHNRSTSGFGPIRNSLS